MKELLESIEQRLMLEGFVKTCHAPELRKFVWENTECVICNILLNHPMTVMNIEIIQP